MNNKYLIREIIQMVMLLVVIAFLSYILSSTNDLIAKTIVIVFIILFSILGAIAYVGYFIVKAKTENKITFDFVNTEYIRTEYGKNIALLLNGLKRYIKEYTLIKEKEIDYIQILENYIPYALALGEADAVEEFIKHNEKYRNLIYNRKSVQ